MYGQQYVSKIENTCGKLFNVYLPCNWQDVSNIFVKGSLITAFAMTNREWVTLHILWNAALSHLFLWLTASKWHCTFCGRQPLHIFSWPIASKWLHCTFCERQSHQVISYGQQVVSDVAHFMWKAVSSYLFIWPTACEWHCTFHERLPCLFIWPTACEWHCTFCERQSHHILSYDKQGVSDIVHFVKGSLITSLQFPWPTGSEWHCTFCEKKSHHIVSYHQQGVSNIAHFVKGSLITSFPITNREWATVHILWKVVSSHPFLSPTACEWHCTFCESQSHHIFSYH